MLAWQFKADGRKRKWVADSTYIWTADCWLYVAAVSGLISRRWVLDEVVDDGPARHRYSGDSDMSAGQARCAAA